MEYVDWLNSAKMELKRSRERLAGGDWEYACFHAQQAVELAFKAYLIRFGNFVKGHDLVRLYHRCRRYGIRLSVPAKEPGKAYDPLRDI